MRRFAAVALPSLRITLARWRSFSPGETPPLAIVLARPGGSVQGEADLLGNTRLDEVSAEARANGVRPGQTIAAARAKVSDLRVRVLDVAVVRQELERLAEVALAFGATVAFEPRAPWDSHRGADVIWVDVTGCAHLFGGEEPLATRLEERMRAMGHEAHVAIADGPRIAAALARHGAELGRGTTVVPPGANADAIRSLPVEALPLDEDSIAWLRTVGVRTIGGLQRLPKHILGTHLGPYAQAVLGLLEGEDLAPVSPYRPPEQLVEEMELEYGLSSIEALLFVTKALCHRVASRLEGRGEAAARVALVSKLERSLANSDAPFAITLAFPTPLVRADDLFAVLRARLESRIAPAAPELEEGALPPVRAVALHVIERVSREAGRPLDLFEAQAKAEVALPRLVGELIAELGACRVGKLELADTWCPEQRTKLVPIDPKGSARSSPWCEALLAPSAAPEPTRWLSRPLVIEREALSSWTMLARIEAVEWWKSGWGVRDFGMAWVTPPSASPRDARGDRGLGWLEHDRRSDVIHLRGWID